MYETPPAGAPRCWGRQYSDHDRECQACPFRGSCKPVFVRSTGMMPQPPATTTQYVPLPQMPPQGYPPPPPGPRVQVIQPPQVQQQPQWNPQWQWQQPPQQMIPRPADNNFLGQYPGESTAERLGKNMVLRAMEAIFTELARFFHFFSWPKRGN